MAIMRASFAGLTAKENIKKATTAGKAIAPSREVRRPLMGFVII